MAEEIGGDRRDGLRLFGRASWRQPTGQSATAQDAVVGQWASEWSHIELTTAESVIRDSPMKQEVRKAFPGSCDMREFGDMFKMVTGRVRRLLCGSGWFLCSAPAPLIGPDGLDPAGNVCCFLGA